MESLHFKRYIAYILDYILVSLLVSAISLSPINKNYNRELELQTEYQEKTQEWNEAYRKIDVEDTQKIEKSMLEYIELSENYAKKIEKASIYDTISKELIVIIYFVLFAYFQDGSTLGKKIMKLKVTNLDGTKPSIIKLTIRTIILYGTIFNLISLLLAFILPNRPFFIAYSILSLLSFGVEVGIFATFIGSKNHLGLHDIIMKTKVEELK